MQENVLDHLFLKEDGGENLPVGCFARKWRAVISLSHGLLVYLSDD